MKWSVIVITVIFMGLGILAGCSKAPKIEATGENSIYKQAEDANKNVEVMAAIRRGFNVNASDEKGQTLLHHAVLGDNVSLADSLIEEFAAKKDIKDNEGNTPYDLTEPNSEMARVFSNEG